MKREKQPEMTTRHLYIWSVGSHSESNRQYDEETEQLSDDLVGVTGKVADLTKAASNNGRGISLFTDETQTKYKDLVDYLGEVSDVMDEISAKNKQELLELLFGKNRANAGAALLTNYKQVYKVIETINESSGSAEREMNTMAESITFKVNEFKETLTDLGKTIFTQDFLKDIVNTGTSVVDILDKIIDKIGIIPTILAGISITKAFKNVGEPLNTPVYAQPQFIYVHRM